MYIINYYTWNTKLLHIVFKTTSHSNYNSFYALCTTPIPIPKFQSSKRHFLPPIITTSHPEIPLKLTILCNMTTHTLNLSFLFCLSHTDVFKQLYIYMYNNHNTLNCIYILSKSLAIFSFIALLIKVDTFL